MTTYAVGDIHGQLSMLEAVLARIKADRAASGSEDASVVFLGDYTDRGPDSKGVIDCLIEGLERKEPWICLAGNHDQMMLGYLRPELELDPTSVQFDWLRENLGGRETLASYGVKQNALESRARFSERAKAAVPDHHVAFLSNLVFSHRAEDCFFAHAGIYPGTPLDEQETMDLIWIRKTFHADTSDHGPLIVHGHTPVQDIDFPGNRLNIDTGAGWGRKLSVVAIEGRRVFELTAEGRRELIPDQTGTGGQN